MKGPRAKNHSRLRAQLAEVRELRQAEKKQTRRKIRSAMKRMDGAIGNTLRALIDARTQLALALEVLGTPEAPGGDMWLTPEQTRLVLGNISYAWLKEMERDGRFPRGVVLEGKVRPTSGPTRGPSAKRYYRLSWCFEYLQERFENDPIAFAEYLIRGSKRSAAMTERRARNKAESEPEEIRGPGVTELTGSEVF